jgi:hypothetical protein
MTVKPVETAVTFGKNYDTDQIYSTGIEFAFAGRKDRKWKQATTFAYCKDFLHDAVWATLNRKPIHVHGFHYAPVKGYKVKIPKEPGYGTENWYKWNDKYGRIASEMNDDDIGGKTITEDLPIHLGRTALLVRNGDMTGAKEIERFHKHRLGCLDFFHQLEKKIGLRRTDIQIIKGKLIEAPAWLVLGDKRWMIAPPMISLYALLVRIGYYHNPGGDFQRTLEMMRDDELGPKNNDDSYDDDQASNDASYLTQAWKGLQVILKHGVKVFHEDMAENYPADIQAHTFHDGYGFVNFVSRRPAPRMSYWYRKPLWK